MLTTVKGIYKEGRVELLEPAPDVQDVEVLVTFMEGRSEQRPAGQMIRRGMFKELGEFTEEDFKAAEFDDTKLLKEFDDGQ